jgi:hypothetical protein
MIKRNLSVASPWIAASASIKILILCSLGIAAGLFCRETHGEESESCESVELEVPFRVEVGDEFINMSKYIGYSAPMWIDLDDDGLDDMLVGCILGYMQFFKNTGTKSEPLFEDQGLLKIGEEDIRISNW